MTKFALYVQLQAKPGKEREVADFLRSAIPLVNAEAGTISWFAIQEGPSSFAIFDTFGDEAATEIVELRRAAHDSVETSLVLMAMVDRMLASPRIGLKAAPGRQFQVA